MQRYATSVAGQTRCCMMIGGEGRQPISHPQWKRFIVTT